MFDRERMDAPLPGENFFADTRNHPWRRPPEMEHPDEFMEYVNRTFKRPHTMQGLDTLVSTGVTITTMTDIFISRSIMDGLITVDFGIMMAGPTAKALELMCVQLGIDYEMGFEDFEYVPTKEHVNRIIKDAEEEGVITYEDDEEDAPVEAAENEDLGLMAPEADLLGEEAEPELQAEMLGQVEEPEDELQ